jgi:hypothetical protein
MGFIKWKKNKMGFTMKLKKSYKNKQQKKRIKKQHIFLVFEFFRSFCVVEVLKILGVQALTYDLRMARRGGEVPY